MKAKDIRVGSVYAAKVSGLIRAVRIDAIREVFSSRFPNGRNVYDVTNLATKRKIVFQSAAKFRYEWPASVPTS